MAKKMLIDATHAEETRVVVVDGNKVEEFDFESESKRQLAGNIYLAKVTRVEPSLQAAFVEYGGNRHGFLAFSEIHPDYYQIPIADREALLAEEMAYNASEEDDEAAPPKPSRRRSAKAASVRSDDPVVEANPDDDADTGTDEPEAAGPARSGGGGSGPEEEDPRDAETDAEARTAAVVAEIPGMDVVDLLDPPEPDSESAREADASPGERDRNGEAADNDQNAGRDENETNDHEPYRAMNDAATRDSQIESVADEDVNDEIRPRPKPRPRRYKIQEVIKVRQILLVQVVKEERGNKGAALTTYLSLAGRYCVLMPNTARGGGISRKITNTTDRKKLKQIASEIDVPRGAGLIIRTAGAQRTKSEIKRDYEYLQRLWEQIRELTLKSIAPTKIYEEGDLIKRSIRDLYNREIDEVFVEGAEGYKTAKSFMKMIMPSHAKNVKLYADQLPLFARYQVESYLSSMFHPVVQLRSGGYIVIGVTEALVAIDVNSGRATKEGSIEQTALNTNLEAAEEIARQLRLRDLAGLVVIDFIDMEERKNNAAVEKRFKEKLKTDRARIQVGRISAFGLLEMSRQRLRPGMLEASTQPCPSCHGTGLLRSDDSLGLQILRQVEEEGTRRKTREVLVRAPIRVANFLMNGKREHIAGIEARYGMAVRIEGDPQLVSPDFSIEKYKTQTRVVEATAPVVSIDPSLMDEIDDAEIVDASDIAVEAVEATPAEEETIEPSPSEEEAPNKKRRRRRRRRKSGGRDGEGPHDTAHAADAGGLQQPTGTAEDGGSVEPEEQPGPDGGEAEAPRKRSRRGSRSRKRSADRSPTEVEMESAPAPRPEEETTGEAPTDPAPTEVDREPAGASGARVSADGEDASVPVEAPREPEEAMAPEAAMPPSGAAADATVRLPEEVPPEDASLRPADQTERPAVDGDGSDHEAREDAEAGDLVQPDQPTGPSKPKRRGWWSFGG